MTEEIKLRPLESKDFFKVIGLINKLDILETIKSIFSGELRETVINKFSDSKGDKDKLSSKELNTQIGYDIALELASEVIQKIPSAQNDVNSFLADLAGLTVEEVDKLPLGTYFKLIRDFFTHNDFKQLSDWLK